MIIFHTYILLMTSQSKKYLFCFILFCHINKINIPWFGSLCVKCRYQKTDHIGNLFIRKEIGLLGCWISSYFIRKLLSHVLVRV